MLNSFRASFQVSKSSSSSSTASTSTVTARGTGTTRGMGKYKKQMDSDVATTASTTTPADMVWPPHPPPGETSEEERERIQREKEAKEVNDRIDHGIELEKQERKKRKREVKIILLGQAESGKSTMLKNFQLNFTPRAFRADAEAWRTVIHLNLIRSVNYVLEVIHASSTPSTSDQRSYVSTASPVLSADVRRLKLGLLPLRSIEAVLSTRLNAEPPVTAANGSTSTPSSMAAAASTSSHQHHHHIGVKVKCNSGWKFLARVQPTHDSISKQRELEAATHVINACGEDIDALWKNHDVQSVLDMCGINLRDTPGFFLDDVVRITSHDYVPTPDDILRARLSTVGVEEHRLSIEVDEYGEPIGRDDIHDWVIYDCGGARSQRAAWAPFFDDVNAILFLASISAFNENLAEDPTVNRLQDSLHIWRTICENRLLADVEIVLFLNKYDILAKKLRAGVRYADYMVKYDDEDGKKNDVRSVAKHLVSLFVLTHKKYAKGTRRLHVHTTTAIDSRGTAKVLNHVRELIIIGNLNDASLL